MSVDYNAGVAFGYALTGAQVKSAANKAKMDLDDFIEFIQEEYALLIKLNAYEYNEDSDFILGFKVQEVDAGYASTLPELNHTTEADVISLKYEYFSEVEGMASSLPQLILYCQIW